MRRYGQKVLEKLNPALKYNLKIRKRIMKLFFFLLLIVCSVLLVLLVKRQFLLEDYIKDELSVAREKEWELREKIDTCELSLSMSTEKFVKEVGVKPCVVLCFDNFAEGAYGDVIKLMDKYGFSGVIVFRDGKTPGDADCISAELYQELLDKGWEGAIGNSEKIRVYNNFPETRREEWSKYIEGMKNEFVEKGFSEPKIYVPHKNEIVIGILDLLEIHNLTTYTRLESTIQEASTEFTSIISSEIGMIVGKYNYRDLSTDVLGLVSKGQSVSVLYKRVESGDPKNNQYTSTYMLGKQLERLSMLDEYINVTTFSGYRQYQQDIIAHNELVYKNYLMEQNAIRNQIALLQSQIAEKYADVFENK